jgi:hypothetical protein
VAGTPVIRQVRIHAGCRPPDPAGEAPAQREPEITQRRCELGSILGVGEEDAVGSAPPSASGRQNMPIQHASALVSAEVEGPRDVHRRRPGERPRDCT